VSRLEVRFALISEGTSERGLVAHLEALCVQAGAAEAEGVFPDLSRLRRPPGRDVESKLRCILGLESSFDLVFVHRDADCPDPSERLAEIAEVASRISGCPPVVPVVPVQALEAWLLADERAIRFAVGRPSGRAPLGLPAPRRIEATSGRKQVLADALARASEKSGRRLQQVKKDFAGHRAILLDRLDLDGPVGDLPSWQALVTAVNETIVALGDALPP
jgi:hypothetical protein